MELDIFTDKIKNIIEEYDFHLNESKTQYDKAILAILLDNIKINYKSEHSFLKLEEMLWLAKEGWNRSKLKNTISIQPLSGPTGLVFSSEGSENCLAVISRPYNCHFNYFINGNFDYLKEVYADCLAHEIDSYIFRHLVISKKHIIDHNKLINYIESDYVVVPEPLFKTFSNKFNCDIIIAPTEISEQDNPIVLAGKYVNIEKYPQLMKPPIFSPYMLFSFSGSMSKHIKCLYFRFAWFDGEEYL